jgi:hypothetical protein
MRVSNNIQAAAVQRATYAVWGTAPPLRAFLIAKLAELIHIYARPLLATVVASQITVVGTIVAMQLPW